MSQATGLARPGQPPPQNPPTFQHRFAMNLLGLPPGRLVKMGREDEGRAVRPEEGVGLDGYEPFVCHEAFGNLARRRGGAKCAGGKENHPASAGVGVFERDA